MWAVSAADVMRLQGQGERFTAFVDALCRAHAYAHGVPLDRVTTNERTNQRDGGVDTRLSVSVPADRTGWFGQPTCWQYKATRHSEVTEPKLRVEAAKPHAQTLVSQGHAYRLAICDSVPDEKVTSWTNVLGEVAGSSPPGVVTADQLAAWAGAYPGVVAAYLRPGLEDARSLDTWSQSITSVTRTYVRVEAWASVERQIEEHVTFASNVPSPVLPIEGDAGVGKTRLVFEVLRRLGADGSAVYTSDDNQARRLARLALSSEQIRAILVVDECSLQARMELTETLRGHSNRIRVIAIHNDDRRLAGPIARPRLDRIPQETVAAILRANFPRVPDDRRRMYGRLAGGFIRLAADLCQNDALLSTGARLGIPEIRDYVSNRLQDPIDRDVVGVVALVSRLGYRDDFADELPALCAVVGVDPRAVTSRLQRLKDAPGFLAMGGRFLYITPTIVAGIAFEDAWQRWIAHDVGGFLSRLPSSLLVRFQDRVAVCGSAAVAEAVSRHFRTWAEGLTPRALTNQHDVAQLEALVETSPGTFMPILERLVLASDCLDEVVGRGGLFGGWGPRRALVWLMERVMAFPEYFHSVEVILFRLAQHETEPKIGNNATEIWRQVLRPLVSGTGTPFSDRIKLLEARVFSADPAVRQVAVCALDGILDTYGHSRMDQRTVVAGRLPPDEWLPRNREEAEDCRLLPLGLFQRMRSSEHADLRAKAIEVVQVHVTQLLYDGHLVPLRRIFETESIEAERRADLVNSIRGFLLRDVARAIERGEVEPSYEAEVRSWLEALGPRDLHERLVHALTLPPWCVEKEEDDWSRAVDELADELVRDPEATRAELEWLTFSAGSAGVLGLALGQRDRDAVLVPILLDPSGKRPVRALQRSYVLGLLQNHAFHAGTINQVIDTLEVTAPASALALATSTARLTEALRRALRLVDAGRLDPVALEAFTAEDLDPAEVRAILERLGPEVPEAGAALERVHAGLRLFSYQSQHQKPGQGALLEDAPLRHALWRLIEHPGEHRNPTHAYHWKQALTSLSQYEPARVAAVAADALCRDLRQREEALDVLQSLLAAHGELVVCELGRVLLRDEDTARLWGEEARKFVAGLDPAHVDAWLTTAAIEGARRLAGALPLPYLEAGRPVVPPLTDRVLSRFGTDERTVREFCFGGHSLQLYSGDIAAQHEEEVEVARAFLGHPLAAIREWATYEIERGTAYAQQERRENEEYLTRE